MSASDKRERMRAAMPATAAIVDEFRAKFGGVAWLDIREGEQRVTAGTRTKDRDVPPIPGVPR